MKKYTGTQARQSSGTVITSRKFAYKTISQCMNNFWHYAFLQTTDLNNLGIQTTQPVLQYVCFKTEEH